MAQFRNPASPEAEDITASNVANTRKVKRFGPKWANIIQIEEQPSEEELHGPASSDTYQAWAIPEYMRSNG